MGNELGKESDFERSAPRNASLASEIWGFLRENKKWWLLPAVVAFAAIALLLLLTSTAAAPFIYTLF